MSTLLGRDVAYDMLEKGVPKRTSSDSLGSREEGGEGNPLWTEPPAPVPNISLDEDTFGMTICSLVRDFYALQRRKGTPLNRISRLVTTLMLLITCIGIQIFLVCELSGFVASRAVHDIRLDYDAFEVQMYGKHTYATENPCIEHPSLNARFAPCHRGKDGYFNASAFWDLNERWNEKSQADACRIPFSQPAFMTMILFIWTLTCFGELRKCFELYMSLIVNTSVVSSMGDALSHINSLDPDESNNFVVSALSHWMKVALTVLVIIPRMGIALVLLWLGCRWLLATNNFSDLILNAVALEFILLMKDTLYVILVPNRNKVDLQGTEILPLTTKVKGSFVVFVGTMSWGLLALAWVFVYMGWIPGVAKFAGLQRVLPDYKWDVHEVCQAWIAIRFEA